MTIIKFMWKKERKKNQNYKRWILCLNTKKKYCGFSCIHLDLNYNIYS